MNATIAKPQPTAAPTTLPTENNAVEQSNPHSTSMNSDQSSSTTKMTPTAISLTVLGSVLGGLAIFAVVAVYVKYRTVSNFIHTHFREKLPILDPPSPMDRRGNWGQPESPAVRQTTFGITMNAMTKPGVVSGV